MALNYQLDNGAGGPARMGMIVLSTDETLENEARQIFASRPVSLLHTRIHAQPDVTPNSLKKMEQYLPDAAAFLPKGLDVIGYGCTSGATIIGADQVEILVQKHHPNTPVTNPISAVIAALKTLNAEKIAFVTPYVASVNAPMIALLQTHGIATIAEASFEQSDDWTVARISANSTLDAIENITKTNDCDAVFVSCTNLRSFEILAEAETRTGVPVVSSNQALLWHMLQLAGVDARYWGPGRLFATDVTG